MRLRRKRQPKWKKQIRNLLKTMSKIFYDIIPPKKSRRKVGRHKKSFVFQPDFNLIRTSFLKIAAFLVIVSLNWGALSAVLQTFGFFGDTEGSTQNIFAAGVLNFELESSTDFPDVCSGEPAERTISIVNYGNPFKYAVSGTEFSGAVCDYVILEANVNGGDPEYTGPLTGFNYGPLDFSDPADWIFKVTFSPDLPAGLLGQTCSFKFVFDGSQTKNDLLFGQGFTDTEEVASNFTAKACCHTEIRSCGYWKNHSNVYKNLLPQTLGGYHTDDVVDTIAKADNILTTACGTCGCGCDNTMRGKLKGQLLVMKFNIANFGIGDYIDATTTPRTLNEIVAEADDLLRQNPPPSNSVLEEMKDLLDYLNNLGQIPFCSNNPPEECKLQLTKTTDSEEVSPGDNITYHLTLDNVGNQVCTGGGVKLKDEFGSSLHYIGYTSTRDPKDFNKSNGYVEWNFGSIYPDDPLIKIDLTMEVKNAHCDSVITNSAKYWSDQTDWGEPVTADSQVVCQIERGVLINEFLPNPVGSDSSHKPKGEWVELYNNSGADVDAAGWWLYDEQDSHELAITNANTNTGNTVIPNGGFLVVYRNGDSDFALDNTGGDSVRLYDGPIGTGNLIDSHIYTIDAPEGKSFARVPDGSSNWVDPIPTPGEENVLEGEDVIFGEAISEPDENIEDGDELLPATGGLGNEEFLNLGSGAVIIPIFGDANANTTEEIIINEEVVLESASGAENQQTETQIDEQPPVEEPITGEQIIEQAPVIEEQPVIVPDTTSGEQAPTAAPTDSGGGDSGAPSDGGAPSESPSE